MLQNPDPADWLMWHRTLHGWGYSPLDQNSGAVLWEVDLGSAVTGHPITYAVDGKQYVAVSTGISVVTEGTNNLTPELSPGSDKTLFVFALP